MDARIYQPAKPATQSGRFKTKLWVVEHEPKSRQEPDRLIGWLGSDDTDKQVTPALPDQGGGDRLLRAAGPELHRERAARARRAAEILRRQLHPPRLTAPRRLRRSRNRHRTAATWVRARTGGAGGHGGGRLGTGVGSGDSGGEHWLLLALTTGAALLGIVTVGSVAGSMLPFLLQRVAFDPATASAPLIAILVDVTGIVSASASPMPS